MNDTITYKTCTKCGVEKSLNDYHLHKKTKDGRFTQCRICVNNVRKLSGSKKRANIKYYEKKKNDSEFIEKRKEYYYNKKNDSEFIEKRKEYFTSNREYFISYKKTWYIENKEHHLTIAKKYYESNKQKLIMKSREYAAKKRKEDMMFKMIENIRCRVKFRIRNKSMTTSSILGCDWVTFKKHIESQFQEGMNWENNGRGEDKWHYDHIIPLASAKTEQDVYRLNHYTNFKPLWEKDNLRKSDKISEEWGNDYNTNDYSI
jgi:hypothetical protein